MATDTTTASGALFDEAQARYAQGDLAQARFLCERVIREYQPDARVWCFMAVLCNQSGEFRKALECAQRSLQLAPRYTQALFNQAVALFNLERTREAIAPLESLLVLDAGHAGAQVLLGKAYLYSGNFDKAIACYEQALEQGVRACDLLTGLADAYEYAHRLDDASHAVSEALKLSPQDVDANIIAARLDTRAGKYPEARQRLERLLKLNMPAHQREAVLHQLGQVCNRMGAYSEAFQAFSGSNRIASSRYAARFDPERFFQRIEKYRRASEAALVDEWVPYAPLSSGKPAPVFLVAFPRSGTTLTEQILSSHSNVVASNEAPYINRLIAMLPTVCPGAITDFPFGLERLSGEQIGTLRNLYWKEVERDTPVKGRRFIDKLPLNIVEVAFIHRIFPDARYILAVRDPRDVCLSAFFQRFRGNNAMAAFLDLDTTARLYKEVFSLWFHYRSVFDLQVHESRYESLVTGIEENARALIDFIGEPWEPAVLEYYRKDRKRDVLTPSYQDIFRPAYTRAMGRWRHYRRELDPVMETLMPLIELWGYSAD